MVKCGLYTVKLLLLQLVVENPSHVALCVCVCVCVCERERERERERL